MISDLRNITKNETVSVKYSKNNLEKLTLH